MQENQTFETDLIHAIFKLVWSRRALERQLLDGTEGLDGEAGAGTSKKNRTTSANGNALRLSCELLRNFVTEAVQRAASLLRLLRRRVLIRSRELTWSGFSRSCFWIFEQSGGGDYSENVPGGLLDPLLICNQKF